jgi:hypothetical protein
MALSAVIDASPDPCPLIEKVGDDFIRLRTLWCRTNPASCIHGACVDDRPNKLSLAL